MGKDDGMSKEDKQLIVVIFSILILMAAPIVIAANWNDILDAKYQRQKARVTAKVSKAIAKRDFVSARTYPTKLEEADQEELFNTINLAELNYVLDQSGIEDAYYLANELHIKQELLEVVSNNLSKMLDNGQDKKIINTLAAWTFDYSFSDRAKEVRDGDIGDARVHINDKSWLDNHGLVRNAGIVCNVFYNDEANKYNGVLDGLVNYGILNDNLDLIKKATKLYRPTAKEVNRTLGRKDNYGNKFYNYQYQQVNTDKNAAIAKARANGIKL